MTIEEQVIDYYINNQVTYKQVSSKFKIDFYEIVYIIKSKNIKRCSGCHKILSLDEFVNSSAVTAKDGKHGRCKTCVTNPPRIKTNNLDLDIYNLYINQQYNYYKVATLLDVDIKYVINILIKKDIKRCSVCNNIFSRSKFPKDPNINDGLNRKCKQCVNLTNRNNTEYFRNYKKERNKIDPSFRLRRIISWKILKNIKQTLNGQIVNKILSLPYTIEELITHLESQFNSSMSWDNYSSHWVIDHIVPHSLFGYKSVTDESFIKCWSLKNLRPLEKNKNRDKWDYISEEWGNIELAKELLNI